MNALVLHASPRVPRSGWESEKSPPRGAPNPSGSSIGAPRIAWPTPSHIQRGFLHSEETLRLDSKQSRSLENGPQNSDSGSRWLQFNPGRAGERSCPPRRPPERVPYALASHEDFSIVGFPRPLRRAGCNPAQGSENCPREEHVCCPRSATEPMSGCLLC